MKNILTLTVACGIALALVFTAAPASAQDSTDLPDPGILPDSPAYFLDDLWKAIRIGFAFQAERKAELRLQYAEEKLAEAHEMAERSNERALERALVRYNTHLAQIEEQYERMNEEQRDRASERVAEATERHQITLERVRDRVPAEAREAIDRAIEESAHGQVTALRELSERRADRAADIAARALERQSERIRRMIDEAEEELLVERRAAIMDTLSEAGENAMSRIEGEVHRITEEQRAQIRARMQESRERAQETLRETLERVPEEARVRLDIALDRIMRIDQPRSAEEIEREQQDRRDRTQEQFGRFIGTLTAPEVTIQMWGTHVLEREDVRYHVRGTSPAVIEQLNTQAGQRVIIVGTLAWYDLEGGFWGLSADRVLQVPDTGSPAETLPFPTERPLPNEVRPDQREERGAISPDRALRDRVEQFQREFQEAVR